MIILSLIESIYIIYMFNYFKTEKYLSHPFDIFTKKIDFIDHSEKENHICSLGNMVGYLLAIWFIVRHYIDKKYVNRYNNIIIYGVLIGCIMTNMNALIYFIPILLIEKYLNKF